MRVFFSRIMRGFFALPRESVACAGEGGLKKVVALTMLKKISNRVDTANVWNLQCALQSLNEQKYEQTSE